MVAALALIAGASSALAPSVLASSAPKESKPLPPSLPLQRVDLKPLPVVAERVGGLKLSVTQVMTPGVPERAACRVVVRAFNGGTNTVSAYALLHTQDASQAAVNTWMVPTGTLAPGESSEKLYSCRYAQYLVVDTKTLGGWPGRCTINGEERSPCPLTIGLEANLNIVTKE